MISDENNALYFHQSIYEFVFLVFLYFTFLVFKLGLVISFISIIFIYFLNNFFGFLLKFSISTVFYDRFSSASTYACFVLTVQPLQIYTLNILNGFRTV